MIGNGRSVKKTGPGYEVVNKFGENLNIDIATVPETIWAHGGVFPFLLTGIEMDFVSTLAADDVLGVGAQILRVTFFDGSDVEYMQEFETDGVTPVQLPGLVKLVSRVEVIQAGSNLTNSGKITFVNRGGATVYQSVEIGEGQTLSTPQMVPSGKKGLVKFIYTEYARAGAAFNDADMRFRIRKANGTILTKYTTTISPNNAYVSKDYGIGGLEMEAGDIAFWECIAVSGNDTPMAAGFDIEFEDI